MQNTLVIGDIHGCYEELQALLDTAGLAEGDAIISLGDAVDRGPETPQVAAFFQNTQNAAALMGNHERKHVRAARHELKLSISQKISQVQLGPAYPAVLDWMAGLPLSMELPEVILVHGYLEPGIPLELQNPSVLCGTMGGDRFLRLRYSRPWYELYNLEKPLIVGHQDYTKTGRPFVYQDKVFGLDTSCVTGKALTGLLLPAFRFVSVPSRGNLWKQVHGAYKGQASQVPEVAIEPVRWSQEQIHKGLLLMESLLCTHQRLLAKLEAVPGFADLTPRQQAKRYSELAGQGLLSTLLHLTRLGQLDIELLTRKVRSPDALDWLINMAVNKGLAP